MKTSYKYIILIVATSALLMVTSCKKTFYTDANTNPDALTQAPLNTILPVIGAGLAYTQGGNSSLYSSLFTQQTFGLKNQAEAYYQYNLTTDDFETPWDQYYTTVMENDYTLMNLADSKGANEYSGIARVLMAYTLQIVVDEWGKVPYSQAFQGSVNLQPAYDNDQTLYSTITSLTAAGIADLNKPAGGIYPTTDDVIYGGVAADWIAFAHAINARIAIHQLKINSSLASQVLSELGQTTGFVNAQVVFGSVQSNGNPWYQFIQNRAGYVSFTSSTLATKLSTLNDPRYPIFIDTVGGADNLGTYYGSQNSPVEFITNEELLFMTAEATITSTGTVGQPAINAYDSAIATNMEKLGIANSAIATYITANPLPTTSTSAAITQLSLQEWIALYLNPEAWTVWRRNASPSLTAPADAKYSVIPRRFLYPLSEYSYNDANLSAAYPGQTVTLFAPRVFWDN